MVGDFQDPSNDSAPNLTVISASYNQTFVSDTLVILGILFYFLCSTRAGSNLRVIWFKQWRTIYFMNYLGNIFVSLINIFLCPRRIFIAKNILAHFHFLCLHEEKYLIFST